MIGGPATAFGVMVDKIFQQLIEDDPSHPGGTIILFVARTEDVLCLVRYEISRELENLAARQHVPLKGDPKGMRTNKIQYRGNCLYLYLPTMRQLAGAYGHYIHYWNLDKFTEDQRSAIRDVSAFADTVCSYPAGKPLSSSTSREPRGRP